MSKEGGEEVLPHIHTDRLMLITFTAEMMKAALLQKSDLEKVTTYQVADGYPSEMYKEILPYKIKRYGQYPNENEWEGIIVHKENQIIIGDMGFRRRNENQEELELGYSIVPSYQGSGYAAEMAQAILEWGLKQPRIKRIVASCDSDNFASIRVLEKVGLNLQGEKERKLHWST